MPADLQSAPFDRFGTHPPAPGAGFGGRGPHSFMSGRAIRSPHRAKYGVAFNAMEPLTGIEPVTPSLPWTCSTS